MAQAQRCGLVHAELLGALLESQPLPEAFTHLKEALLVPQSRQGGVGGGVEELAAGAAAVALQASAASVLDSALSCAVGAAKPRSTALQGLRSLIHLAALMSRLQQQVKLLVAHTKEAIQQPLEQVFPHIFFFSEGVQILPKSSRNASSAT